MVTKLLKTETMPAKAGSCLTQSSVTLLVRSFLLSDHLGSTSITVNPSGNKIAEMRYREASPERSEGDDAFPLTGTLRGGNTRYTQGDTPTDYQYREASPQRSEGDTGQRFESGIGLYYYNARWYDPALGRFAQADTVVPQGPQGYDRYAYVNNDPVNATDPTGHACHDVDMNGHIVRVCDPEGGNEGTDNGSEGEEEKAGDGEKDPIPPIIAYPDPKIDWNMLNEFYNLTGVDVSDSSILPPEILQWFIDNKDNLAVIWSNGNPSFFANAGRRLFMIDSPHGGADFVHLNTDLNLKGNILDKINHLNLEPAIMAVISAVKSFVSIVSSADLFPAVTIITPSMMNPCNVSGPY